MQKTSKLVAAARASQRGFTLVEILVVLAIIGLIMGGVAVVAGGALGDARIDTAKNETMKIAGYADMYSIKKKGKCPSDMKALKSAGIIKKVSRDPWDNDYKIVCEDGGVKGVASAGPDGEWDNADDINSWDESKPEGEEDEG
jgi:general secretion pathway protein G